MITIRIIPVGEFQRVWRSSLDLHERLAVLADMCRFNALATIKRAGSGHLGSSFSSLDIVTWLYYAELNTVTLGFGHPDRDIFFSSKGHDAPGLYAVLFSLGILPRELFVNLRRLKGTCGHPDISLPGVEANSGSLGMGISKGKGMAFAKRLCARGGRVIVMVGDGELQEGQVYEALQTATHQRLTNLSVIVDHNTIQTDKPVSEICDLGDLEAKLRAFGWHVARCDGHDFRQLETAWNSLREVTERPKILIADTIKGRGVSFMEHPAALRADQGSYRWHSGAPDDVSFIPASDELMARITRRLTNAGIPALELEALDPEPLGGSSNQTESVGEAFGHALVELAASREDLVVLDADLAADCHLREFEARYPARFIENGIAEQDMVSMAGGLALQGLLPVVNSFAAFLGARANEQAYANASERRKIIYICHYAGLIPAGPGHSHQSVRDIALFGSLPNVVILQPCNPFETRLAMDYCVREATEGCMIRLFLGKSPGKIKLPTTYRLKPGCGVVLVEGTDAILFAYGPVMLHEALRAARLLSQRRLWLKVVNMPWLNRVDLKWLEAVIQGCGDLYVLEDHTPVGGLADALLPRLVEANLLEARQLTKLAVEDLPAWGTASEVLQAHQLDYTSIAEHIWRDCRSKPEQAPVTHTSVGAFDQNDEESRTAH